MKTVDPLEFAKLFWPDVYFYKQQREIIYATVTSIDDPQSSDETYVPAGNMLGKDFVSGFIALYFFMTRYPCRVITTSVKEPHLRVLWGEINRFIQESKCAIKKEHGGPLIVNHQEIRRWDYKRQEIAPLCYIAGMVAGDTGEGLSGHHIPNTGDGIPRTLFIGDESSGLEEVCFTMASAWANRMLLIGNCWQCENSFKHAVKGRPGTEDRGGDIRRENGIGFHRKIIKIKATDSPNVRRGLERIKMGLEPDDKIIVPGVKSWGEYQRNRKLWDPIKQSVGLDAEFYEGAEVRLFPPEWLDIAERIGEEHKNKLGRKAKAIGVDSAEGGDQTALCAVDEDGVIELISLKTPDTSEIPDMVLKFMRKHQCSPENVLFDRGGGGYQHVCILNRMGFKVRSIAFGEAPNSVDHWKYFHTRKERRMEAEEKTIYKNRRAEMYGTLRDLINPAYDTGFGIARRFVAIRQQLEPIPLWWEDGKLILPPKHAKPDSKDDKKVTMTKLIGHSPDEADSLVLAVYGMTHKPTNTMLGSMI